MGDPKVSPARAKADEIKRQTQRKQRRQTMALYGALAGVAMVLIALAALGIRNAGDDKSASSNRDLASVSGVGAASAPPWPLPADARARVNAAGLNLGRMGTADHYHAHIAVIVNGQSVPLLEGIGIDPNSGAMSAVHTHSADGLIHVEAGTKGQPFTVGQLFTQWDVRLTRTQIGALKVGGGNTVTVYVNGKEYTGNPAMIVLADKQQVAVVYGPKEAAKPPAPFTFPDNL